MMRSGPFGFRPFGTFAWARLAALAMLAAALALRALRPAHTRSLGFRSMMPAASAVVHGRTVWSPAAMRSAPRGGRSVMPLGMWAEVVAPPAPSKFMACPRGWSTTELPRAALGRSHPGAFGRTGSEAATCPRGWPTTKLTRAALGRSHFRTLGTVLRPPCRFSVAAMLALAGARTHLLFMMGAVAVPIDPAIPVATFLCRDPERPGQEGRRDQGGLDDVSHTLLLSCMAGGACGQGVRGFAAERLARRRVASLASTGLVLLVMPFIGFSAFHLDRQRHC